MLEIPQVSVLLIEDDPIDTRLIKIHLAESNKVLFDVMHTFNLNGAMELVGKHNFDVIVTDLSLTDSTGSDTLISVLQKTDSTPVVVLTGNADPQSAIQALHLGAEDYLNKNFINSEMLERVITYSIERHKTRRALKARENQLRAITDNNIDGLAIVDLNGILHFSNPALERILGSTKENLLDLPFRFYFEQGSVKEFTTKDNSDGQKFLEISKTDIPWDGVMAHLFLVRDVTDRKRSETLKQEAEVLNNVQQLSAAIAHEFSQPLQVLSGALELMELDGDVPKRISKCKDMTIKIIQLVKNLSEITRLQKRPYLGGEILDIKRSTTDDTEMMLR